ncbi:hypothetical protein AB5J56_05020 [Streptomyces sp. R21]|uniref:Uncharacterized protein n=1 Tax=Streptomyces sp. R21 TaxID=3238627 RepID=A0AB39PS93_9ACTN
MTGSTNGSRSPVELTARTELTTPEKRITKPTNSVVTTASQVRCATSVPTQISTAQAIAGPTCARRRSTIEPLWSTSNSMENALRAAL